jgi:hypothetical protein
MSAAAEIFLVLVLARFYPLDITGPAGDVLSISCPEKGFCLFLDSTGGVLMLDVAAERWQLRQREPAGLRKILFASLLKGWALDASGRLWESRDGGRGFSPAGEAPAEKWRDLAWTGEWLLLVSESGRLWSLQAGEWKKLRRPGQVLLAVDGPRVLVMDETGQVWRSADGGLSFEKMLSPPQRAAALGWLGEKPAVLSARLWLFDEVWWTEAARFALRSGFFLGGRQAGLLVSEFQVGVVDHEGRAQQASFSCGSPWLAAATDGQSFFLGGRRGAVGRVDVEQGKLRPRCLVQASIEVMALAAGSDGTFWKCTPDGLTLSRDGGRSFDFTAGVPCQTVAALEKGRALALGAGGEVFLVDAAGSRRRLVAWPDGRVSVLGAAGAVFAAAGVDGFFARSLNGGHSWTLSRGPWEGKPLKLRLLPSGAGYLLSERGRLFASGDGGGSWAEKASGVTDFALPAEGGLVLVDGSGQGSIENTAGERLFFRTSLRVKQIFSPGRRRLLLLDGCGRLFQSGPDAGRWAEIELAGHPPLVHGVCSEGSGRCVFADAAGRIFFGVVGPEIILEK